MNNIIGFYNSVKDIGSHEKHFTRVGDFSTLIGTYRISYVEDDSNAVIWDKDKFIPLKVGMIIGENALIKTNNSRVEIESLNKDLYRMLSNSEFCLERTIHGIVPVYYGNVYVNSNNKIYSYGKYRTSCWIGNFASLYTVENTSANSDTYYSYTEPVEIYEYDECGNRFVIVTLAPFQKCILHFDFSKSLRARYAVVEIKELNSEDVVDLYQKYLVPTNWKQQEDYKNKENAV